MRPDLSLTAVLGALKGSVKKVRVRCSKCVRQKSRIPRCYIRATPAALRRLGKNRRERYYPPQLRVSNVEPMFDWLKFKTYPKTALPIYLGDVAVAPNSIATDWFGWGIDKTHLKIKQWIVESLDLSFESEITEAATDYYILDIVVSYDEQGMNGLADLLLWRPELKLLARLHKRSNMSTIQNFKTVKTLTTLDAFNRSFSITGLLGGRVIAKEEDFEWMTTSALVDLIAWLKIHVDKV